MPDSLNEILRAWQNFYMLVGGAAASLIGLVFVAASLATRLVDADAATDGARTFVTPIMVYFSTVLIVALLIMVPTHTLASLGGYLSFGGVAGLAYVGTTAVQVWRHHRRRARLSRADWWWRVYLPVIGYVLILSAAVGLLTRAPRLLNSLAFAVVILSLLGVRNAWDLLLWISRQRLHSG